MACEETLDLKPLLWDWSAITQGDTYPASNIVDVGGSTVLASVEVKIRNSAGSLLLTLSSPSSGVTITATGAGSWEYTIDAISATDTATLTAETLRYDLQTTDTGGNASTVFAGAWRILSQITG